MPSVRDARPADLDALVQLELSCFPAEDAFSRRQYRGLLANPRASVRVIRQGGAVVASAVLLRRGSAVRKPVRPRTTREPGLPSRPRPPHSARLYSIAVSPDCRGQGLGQKLLADVIRLCRSEGVRRLHLEVRFANEAAIALYRKFGFEIDRHLPHYYGHRQHGVKMAVSLGGPA